MKNFLLKLIKLKTIILIFVLLQSCIGKKSESINVFDFDQIQIMRDGTKVDSVFIDTISSKKETHETR